MPLWQEGTLNSRQAASSLVRLAEGEERPEAPEPPRVFSLKIGGGAKLKRIVTCIVLKATDNDRCTSSPLP
ncbi:hypothetical protein TNCV_2861081 [Trichonephila clavipes]|nr:hypothetical protein TNCV_2861081 [Trichonephila clavipes]